MKEQKPKTYIRCNFHIDSGYEWGRGMDQDACRKFYDEIILLFTRKGWSIICRDRGNVVNVVNGKSSLYVHPMELTGPCEESLIPEVRAILGAGTTFRFTSLEKFEALVDATPEQVQKMYEDNNEQNDRLIVEAFKTPSKDKYVNVFTVLFDLGWKVKIKTTTDYVGVRCSGDQVDKYLNSRFDELVKEGKILLKETNNIDYARSA